jgi:hypothetical protein
MMHFLKRWNLEKAGAEYVSRVAISLGQLLYSHAGNDDTGRYSLQYSNIVSLDSVSVFR